MISVIILFTSCDKIDGPYYNITDGFIPDVKFPDLDISKVYRKMLIEEYTGHRCSNCPDGHVRLAELLSLYGDTLVGVCIHAGVLARTNDDYPYNFTTEAGTQLFQDFGLDPIPRAVVNRTKYQNKWDINIGAWHNALLDIDRSKIYAAIQMINEYKSSENTLLINTKTTMLAEYDNPLLLSIFLIEDDIISPQLNGSTRIPDYKHEHALRLGVNGTYGTPLVSGGILEKDSAYLAGFKVNFSGTDWKVENTSIIAILHAPETREVLQVEIIKN